MKALYICSDRKCNKEKIVHSISNQAHFKRCRCECGKPMHFKEITKDEDA